jgi:hypothetical protein
MIKTLAIVAVVIFCMVWFVGRFVDLPSDRATVEGYERSAKDLAAEGARRRECIDKTIPTARTMADAGQFQQARDLLDDCIKTGFDMAVRRARDEVQARWQMAWLKENPKAPWESRLAAMRDVIEFSPDMLGPYAAEYKRSSQRYEQEADRLKKQAESEDRARRKKEGVRIGMSKEEVLMSSWGRPESINTSAYTFGTREQWVYGNGHYLYFQNDVLSSISTRK